MKANILLIILLFLLSCKREKITEHHEEFCGVTWRHNISAEETQYISIETDGHGMVEWWKNGTNTNQTPLRKWFVKNDYLLLGRRSRTKSNDFNSYKITLYPTKSNNYFILDYDTIRVGDKYITLDDKVFVVSATH